VLEPARFVRVADLYYDEQAWLEAFNVEALAAINSALARPSTERGVFRALQGLRVPATHRRVLGAALSRLVAAAPGTTRMQVGAVCGRVVAAFSGSLLDKPSAAP